MLDFAGDCEQCLHLLRDLRRSGIAPDLRNQVFVSVQMFGGNCSMDGMTVEAVVPGRDKRSDEFALAGSESARAAKQYIGQLIQGFCRLRPNAINPRIPGMSAGTLMYAIVTGCQERSIVERDY